GASTGESVQSCESFRKTWKSFFCASFRSRAKKEGHGMPCPYVRKIKSANDLELFFLGDVDDHLRGDVAEDFDGDGIFAEGFDGIGDLHLALVDLEVLGG